MTDLFDKRTLEQRSVDLLRSYQPKDHPYYGGFSGGKDSCVIKELAKRAGVNVVWHYNVTTIDPPELTRFIKRHHADVVWERPEENFFACAENRGFPTRIVRWCCEEFKESRSPIGSTLIMGVRWAESARRRKAWREVTMHIKTHQVAISPILYWSDEHVWQYIRDNSLPYCSLYDEGFKRLGCIGCPMARAKGRQREFVRWPHFERRWK